jgi:putative transposase
MYEFRRQLTYKCELYGSELITVSRFFPSSKTCSCCGHIQDMPLKERVFNCQQCNISIDRDLNAAQNLEHQALILA